MLQVTRTQSQLGTYLRRVRKAKGLTQTDLSDRIRRRQATVSNLESHAGGATLDTLFAVLAALDLELVVRPRTKNASSDLADLF
jgi:HTH-type transcriptional regulator/antitoxin HipB